MHAFRIILPIATVALAATLCGCGEEKPAASPTTETTGAMVDATRNQLAQLERERNEARAALMAERANEEKERQNFATETSMRREHDALEDRILLVLEKADQDIQGMRDKAAKSSPKVRKDMEQSIGDAQAKRTKLYADMRRLNGDLGQPWDSFKADVESTITDLNRVLATPADVGKPTDSKAKGPGSSNMNMTPDMGAPATGTGKKTTTTPMEKKPAEQKGQAPDKKPASDQKNPMPMPPEKMEK